MSAAIALLTALATQSPLSGALPRPTGRNGYEEYVQAAQLLRTPEAAVYAFWTPGAKPPPEDPYDPDDLGPTKATVALYAHLSAMSPLEVRREELRRYGRALALVAQGNAKPAFDPRSSLGPDTIFPELASFRALSRFAARAATVHAADGATDRAVGVLTDGLVLADNVGRGTLIANLFGAVSTAVVLGAFSDLLPRLSLTDALRVQRTVESILARTPAARSVTVAELSMVRSSLRQAFASKEELSNLLLAQTDDDKPDPKAQAMARELSAMSPAARARLLRTIEARLESRARQMDAALAGPEREWTSRLAALADDEEGGSDLGDVIIGALSPAYGGFATVAVRTRTQLRLLGLHAKLIQHRWEYGRLPETLDAVDPLTGEPYLYETRDDGTVRLASKGIPQTGEIELRYRRVAPVEAGGKP